MYMYIVHVGSTEPRYLIACNFLGFIIIFTLAVTKNNASTVLYTLYVPCHDNYMVPLKITCHVHIVQGYSNIHVGVLLFMYQAVRTLHARAFIETVYTHNVHVHVH